MNEWKNEWMNESINEWMNIHVYIYIFIHMRMSFFVSYTPAMGLALKTNPTGLPRFSLAAKWCRLVEHVCVHTLNFCMHHSYHKLIVIHCLCL